MANFDGTQAPAFFAGGTVSGAITPLIVPPSTEWVITDCVAYDDALIGTDVVEFLHAFAGGGHCMIAFLRCSADPTQITTPGTQPFQHWVGFHVIPAGDSLIIQNGAPLTASYAVNGLLVVPSFPMAPQHIVVDSGDLNIDSLPATEANTEL